MEHFDTYSNSCKRFVVYDLSEWPLVKCTLDAIVPHPDEFDAHLECFRLLLHKDQDFMIMFDLTNAKTVPLQIIKKQADFLQKFQPKIKDNLVATSIVTSSNIVQGILQMLFTIKKPSKPNKSFTNTQDAHDWMQLEWDKEPHTHTCLTHPPTKYFFE